eukprot:350208-Chlamydomonas_euryale.AAC.5
MPACLCMDTAGVDGHCPFMSCGGNACLHPQNDAAVAAAAISAPPHSNAPRDVRRTWSTRERTRRGRPPRPTASLPAAGSTGRWPSGDGDARIGAPRRRCAFKTGRLLALGSGGGGLARSQLAAAVFQLSSFLWNNGPGGVACVCGGRPAISFARELGACVLPPRGAPHSMMCEVTGELLSPCEPYAVPCCNACMGVRSMLSCKCHALCRSGGGGFRRAGQPGGGLAQA